jgi:hypothetical protein
MTTTRSYARTLYRDDGTPPDRSGSGADSRRLLGEAQAVRVQGRADMARGEPRAAEGGVCRVGAQMDRALPQPHVLQSASVRLLPDDLPDPLFLDSPLPIEGVSEESARGAEKAGDCGPAKEEFHALSGEKSLHVSGCLAGLGNFESACGGSTPPGAITRTPRKFACSDRGGRARNLAGVATRQRASDDNRLRKNREARGRFRDPDVLSAGALSRPPRRRGHPLCESPNGGLIRWQAPKEDA